MGRIASPNDIPNSMIRIGAHEVHPNLLPWRLLPLSILMIVFPRIFPSHCIHELRPLYLALPIEKGT